MAVVIMCWRCDQYAVAKSPRRKFCDRCQSERRREQTRRHVAAHRRRNGHTSPQIPHPRLPKERFIGVDRKLHDWVRIEGRAYIVSLPCGHESRNPCQPIEGEELFCGRCQDWVEFTAGRKRPLCDAGLHRMTPFNMKIDPATRRKGCKRCILADTAE